MSARPTSVSGTAIADLTAGGLARCPRNPLSLRGRRLHQRIDFTHRLLLRARRVWPLVLGFVAVQETCRLCACGSIHFVPKGADLQARSSRDSAVFCMIFCTAGFSAIGGSACVLCPLRSTSCPGLVVEHARRLRCAAMPCSVTSRPPGQQCKRFRVSRRSVRGSAR